MLEVTLIVISSLLLGCLFFIIWMAKRRNLHTWIGPYYFSSREKAATGRWKTPACLHRRLRSLRTGMGKARTGDLPCESRSLGQRISESVLEISRLAAELRNIHSSSHRMNIVRNISIGSPCCVRRDSGMSKFTCITMETLRNPWLRN